MVQDIISKVDCHSACQKISCFLMEPEGSCLKLVKFTHILGIGPILKWFVVIIRTYISLYT